MAKKKIFEIDEDSIIKATKGGYYYCCTIPPSGEIRGDRKKRYKYLHRARMEQKLNRFLHEEEQVDHKNGDKTDNSPSNLILRERGPHQKSHTERGNHFWKKSPRNKPGRKAALNVVARFIEASAVLKEEYAPVKKFTEKKKVKDVVAKFLEQAELYYKGFTVHPAYKRMPKMFPDYNGGQAEEATDYLMKVFKKEHPLLDEGLIKRIREKILAGIT